jgi:hypothetical protein
MTHDSQRILKANLRQYKTPTTKDAYERGFERGFNCASWQDLPEVGAKLWLDGEGRVTVDEANQWDVLQSLAYEGESNDRCYSPFEFTASEFNKARNSEARWEAFDAGISDGISANIGERMNALTDKLVS